MAFDATSPYAMACLSDSAKSVQSLTVLRQEEPAEARVRNLMELASSWDVTMAEEEAEQVVAEFDLVVAANPKANSVLGASAISAISAIS